MNDASGLVVGGGAADEATDFGTWEDASRAREAARVSEVNDRLPRPYAGTRVAVVLPPSDTIPADYVEMGRIGQWRLGGELEGLVVYEGGEILAGDMDFGGPEGARRWAAALLSAAVVSEEATRSLGDRQCRVCGCTDSAACQTITGPCAWRVTYADDTGICTACQVPGNPA